MEPSGSAATVATIVFLGVVQPFRTLPDGVSISNIRRRPSQAKESIASA